ncbi:MAG TPA: transcriptional regulator, partial [Firmicutes bacterium]|nr:transcriptional regulator [Bacillota bacterium]
TGKVKAVRFSTLEAICRVLQCQPGDILEYEGEGAQESGG